LSPALGVLDLDAGLFHSPFTAFQDPQLDPAAESAPDGFPKGLPKPFLAALARRLGASANARRVARPFGNPRPSGGSGCDDGGLTAIAQAELGFAMAALLGPRHLPTALADDDDDDADDDDDEEEDLSVVAAKRAAQSARNKLKRGVISRVMRRV
jgi:hypothetical protein